MRKSELKLKTMRRKLSIESSDLDLWLFSFGISQPGVLGLHGCTSHFFPCLLLHYTCSWLTK